MAPTTGQRLLAADLQAALVRVSVKTADTSRTSTTSLADDPHLQATDIATSTRFGVHIVGTYNAAATPDLKVNFSFPTGTTGTFGGSDGTVIFSGVSLGTDFNFTASGGSTVRFELWGTILTSTTAGNFVLRSAQVASNASASTLHAGTIMRLYPTL